MLIGIINTKPIYIHDTDLSEEELKEFNSSEDDSKIIFLNDFAEQISFERSVILTNDYDQNRIYESSELYFSIYVDPQTPSRKLIVLSIIEEFDNEGTCSNNISPHNLVHEQMIKAGISDSIGDSTFKYENSKDSVEEIMERIKSVGFQYSKRFDDEMNGIEEY